MLKHANRIVWVLIPLCLAGSAAAQDSVIPPNQKSKEAMDKLKAAPGAVGKTLQALGKKVGSKLGVASGEANTAILGDEQEPAPEINNGEYKQPTPPILVKRDPFRPFTLEATNSRQKRERLSPLERYELGQLKLVGVIWDVKQPNAMVEDGAGLGYVVKPGTPIGPNEGKVKKIQPAGLVIEEYEVDVYGTKRKVERNMRLATEKAE
jgi:type IV pilus assembly protein PilP